MPAESAEEVIERSTRVADARSLGVGRGERGCGRGRRGGGGGTRTFPPIPCRHRIKYHIEHIVKHAYLTRRERRALAFHHRRTAYEAKALVLRLTLVMVIFVAFAVGNGGESRSRAGAGVLVSEARAQTLKSDGGWGGRFDVSEDIVPWRFGCSEDRVLRFDRRVGGGRRSRAQSRSGGRVNRRVIEERNGRETTRSKTTEHHDVRKRR